VMHAPDLSVICENYCGYKIKVQKDRPVVLAIEEHLPTRGAFIRTSAEFEYGDKGASRMAAIEKVKTWCRSHEVEK